MLRAYKINSGVYLFNENNFVKSCYDIHANGFVFSVTKLSELKFNTDEKFIKEYRNCKELSEHEFNQFINHITAIQENVSNAKPLVTFDEHLTSLIQKFGINYKDYL